MVRLLVNADVEELIDLPQAMACLEQAFLEQGRGAVVPWPPSLMSSGSGKLILRSGGLAESGRYGVRVTTGPEHPSFALLYSSPGGELLSIMTYPFSDLRLDASVALGVRTLAKPRIERVAMLGSGRLALGMLQAIRTVRAYQSVRVYSRQPANRTAFAARAADALELPVAAVDTPHTAVEGADLVLVSTNSQTPALYGDWLEPDADVVSIGSRFELDASVFLRAALVTTTSKVQELNVHEYSEQWPLVQLDTAGQRPLDQLLEFGAVLASGQPRPAGITVFRDAQGGFTDIALAAHVYARAIALGCGTEWLPC